MTGTEAVEIRPETLRAANDGWEKPEPAEVEELIRRLGLTQSGVARLLGLTVQTTGGARQIRRWVSGEVNIPYSAWALLCYQAGFGPIWVSK